MTKKVGFFVHTAKEKAPQIVADVSELLKKEGVIPLVPNKQAKALNRFNGRLTVWVMAISRIC